ncbi:xylulokinase [Alicyclobacillus dauci]|uniref:FGGY family carbohydrate kinase n=1 Tax=Alicyclobacillus dauci TaxID=1475485 RepID=A0ABY6Z5A5_9BACL|nr:FGGY family carbohydrate kinase [Alicyclobacillus dauci]WAH38041.1 FGGY family carbohydrate kinase [Alicyclobacillus dauci]
MIASILVIDLGSSACKAILFAKDGTVLAVASEAYPTWHPDDVRAEQHPDDWWQATTKAVKLVLTSVESTVKVQGIGLTSQRETVLPLDKEGHPLHPAILWMDKRGIEWVGEVGEVHQNQIQEWTGLVPGASYSAGKIHWLKQQFPDLEQKTAFYVQPKDYLVFRLTGVMATDRSLASRTMLYNIRSLDWQDELLDALDLDRERLPEVHSPGSVIGVLRSQVASEWGLQSGLPVVLGGGDRQCEVLGSGITTGEAIESTGTTSNIACVVDDLAPYKSDRIACSVHVVDGEWILEQGMSTTGAAISWLHGLLDGNDDVRNVDDALRKSVPGAAGLIALPFFMGARAPRWNPNAQGAMMGLTLGHKVEDIYRAVLEGIGYELRYAIQTYEEIGLAISRIRLTGGGAGYDNWNQTKASIYQKRLASPKVLHAAAFGAFLLTARELGWISSFEEGQKLNPLVSIYHPDSKEIPLYDVGYKLYMKMYDLFSDANMWEQIHTYRNMKVE